MTCESIRGPRMGGPAVRPGRADVRAQHRAALAAAVARKRAEQMARERVMSPAEIEAFEAAWRERAERSIRAREAQRSGRRVRRPRADNPAPAPTVMWSKAMSLQAAIDTRLTMGARQALQVIRTLTARSARVSRAGLATLLGVCQRSAQRYLSELRQYGYIRTRLITTRAGWVVGQAIEIAEVVLPRHHRPRLAASIADGFARCLSALGARRTPGETALSPSKSEELHRERGGGGLGALVLAGGGS